MSVLLREKLKDRVKVYKRFVAICEKLRTLGNYHRYISSLLPPPSFSLSHSLYICVFSLLLGDQF